MRLPNNPKREKQAIVLVFIGVPAGLIAPVPFADLEILAIPLVFLAIGSVGFALVYVRRLPRIVFSGLIGGGVAGLVFIGAGSRLAMRIVSLTGARREMTIDGTLFLLISGAMLGALIGVMLAALRRVRPLRVGPATLVLGLLGVAFFVGPRDIRHELMDDGLGFWLNGPLFFSLLPAYAWGAIRSIAFLDRSLPGRRRGRPIAVTSS